MVTVALTSVKAETSNELQNVYQFLVSTATTGTPETIITPGASYTLPSGRTVVFGDDDLGWEILSLSVYCSASTTLELLSASTALNGSITIPTHSTYSIENLTASEAGDAFRIETDTAYSGMIIRIRTAKILN